MSLNVAAGECPSNCKMRLKRLAAICLVLALWFHGSVAATMSSMGHGRCGGLIAVADTIAATPCCNERSPDQPILTGGSECSEVGVSITKTLAGEPCASPTCDCAGAGSPAILSEAMAEPNIAAPFVPLRLQGALPSSLASDSLERPPRDTLS